MKIELSFMSIIFIVFLILKLCGVIGWSWWWITCPLWIPAILFTLILIIRLLVINFSDGNP